MEDREIIQLFFDRDERAIAESRDKYGKYCDGIAAGILHTREDREECVSDTWLRAWQTIPPQNPASLKAYLGRLCRCFAIDRYRHLRRRKRSRDMECVLTELDGICPNEPVTDGLKETLTAFLRGLEPWNATCSWGGTGTHTHRSGWRRSRDCPAARSIRA